MNKYIIPIVSIVASYLIVMLPVVYATDVNVYLSVGGSKGARIGSARLADFLSIGISKKSSFSGYSIDISVENKTQALISEAYIYKCKGIGPDACMSTYSPQTLQVSGNKISANFPWAELTDKTVGYPQTGNVFLVFKIADPSLGTSWQGYWYQIKRTGDTFPDPYLYKYDVDSIDLVSTVPSESIKFIQERGMVPVEDGSVVEFTGATELIDFYGSAPPKLSTKKSSGSSLSSFDKYSFVFKSSLHSPVVLSRESLSSCNKDAQCDEGESASTCCHDCSCNSGQYCSSDTDSCEGMGSMRLNFINTPNTIISNCKVQNTITVNLEVVGFPSDRVITKKEYVLNGDQRYTIQSCAEIGGDINRLSCQIIIPPNPNCNEGSFSLDGNYIEFSLVFKDGARQGTKTLKLDIPKIIVGSWKCKNNVCETEMGETCCYDCQCSGNSYCDAAGEYGLCKSRLSSSSVYISPLSKTHFYQDPQGKEIEFYYEIAGAPSSLSAYGESCSASCSSSEACTASCYISCNKVSSSPYNASCTLSFVVDSYDNEKDYNIVPTMQMDLRYRDYYYGAGDVHDRVSKQLPTINFGSNWCGNRQCDGMESPSTCCYDCPCGDGYYCDSQNKGSPSLGDSCKQNNFQIKINPTTTQELSGVNSVHNVDFDLEITNTPSSARVEKGIECDLGEGDLSCMLGCSEKSLGKYKCTLVVPSFKRWGESDYFNPSSKSIELKNNLAYIPVTYNDGPKTERETFRVNLPDIHLTPETNCGDGNCDSVFGENVDTCCVDCRCGKVEEFCYDGVEPRGVCLSNTSIRMEIVKIEPSPYKCTIQSYRDPQCNFLSPVKIIGNIINPPEDFEIKKSFIKYNGEKINTISCDSMSNGTFSCFVELPPLNSTVIGIGGLRIVRGEEGIVRGSLDFHAMIEYPNRFGDKIYRMSQEMVPVNSEIVLEKVKSDVVRACEKGAKDLDEKIKIHRRIVAIVIIVLAFMAAITVVACILSSGTVCKWCVIITGCAVLAFSLLILQMGETIKQLKEERKRLCEVDGIEPMESQLGEMGEVYGGIASSTMMMLGCIAIVSSIAGSGGAAAGGPTSPPPSPG